MALASVIASNERRLTSPLERCALAAAAVGIARAVEARTTGGDAAVSLYLLPQSAPRPVEADIEIASGNRERCRDRLGRLALDVDSTQDFRIGGKQGTHEAQGAWAGIARAIQRVGGDPDVRCLRRPLGSPRPVEIRDAPQQDSAKPRTDACRILKRSGTLRSSHHRALHHVLRIRFGRESAPGQAHETSTPIRQQRDEGASFHDVSVGCRVPVRNGRTYRSGTASRGIRVRRGNSAQVSGWAWGLSPLDWDSWGFSLSRTTLLRGLP
jgi:hypothetical protein